MSGADLISFIAGSLTAGLLCITVIHVRWLRERIFGATDVEAGQRLGEAIDPDDDDGYREEWRPLT